jgi:hypothetical protein
MQRSPRIMTVCRDLATIAMLSVLLAAPLVALGVVGLLILQVVSSVSPFVAGMLVGWLVCREFHRWTAYRLRPARCSP